MKSIEAKKIIQRYFYHNGFNMSCTEFGVIGGWADVFVIKRNGYTNEFEVKVDEKDLLSEIACLDYLLNGDSRTFIGKINKEGKHRTYVNNVEHYLISQWIIPNKFSFVVTKIPLRYEEILEICKVVGYGFYIIHTEKDHRYGDSLEKILEPKFLHMNKINEMIKDKFLQRCFQENYNNFVRADNY